VYFFAVKVEPKGSFVEGFTGPVIFLPLFLLTQFARPVKSAAAFHISHNQKSQENHGRIIVTVMIIHSEDYRYPSLYMHVFNTKKVVFVTKEC